MFSVLETILLSVKKHRFGTYGDTADRLNHRYTVVILLLLSLVVCAKQYVGSPIQCWLPHEYRDAWEEYVETLCFVESTYFVPLDERVQEHVRLSDLNYRKVAYYQWVPIVLALQAALFYAPHMLWKACSDWSGIKLQSILKVADDSTSTSERGQRARSLASQIVGTLMRQRRRTPSFFGLRHRRFFGTHLCLLYLLHKCFYLINAVAQFLTLNSFLNTDYDSWLWGGKVLRDLLESDDGDRSWTDSGHFPRLVVCNYPVRRKSENVWESAQCVLMINMLNEKIFIFLWFWFALVSMFNLGNLIWSGWKLFRITSSCHLIDDYLTNRVEAAELRKFVRQFLTRDGCLVLRFVHRCGDEALSAELIDLMFEMYVQFEQRENVGDSEHGFLLPKPKGPKQFVRRPLKSDAALRICEKIGESDEVEVATEDEVDVKLYCIDECKEAGQKLL